MRERERERERESLTDRLASKSGTGSGGVRDKEVREEGSVYCGGSERGTSGGEGRGEGRGEIWETVQGVMLKSRENCEEKSNVSK